MMEGNFDCDIDSYEDFRNKYQASEFKVEVEGAVIYGEYFEAQKKKFNGGLVVFTHGYTGAGSEHYDLIEKLLDAGYSVVTYDLRAHGHSTGNFDVDAMVEDLSAIIDHVSENYVYDERKLVTIGYSMGGYLTTREAAEDDRVKLVISISGPISVAKAAEDRCPRTAAYVRNAVKTGRIKYLAFPARFKNLKINHFGYFLQNLFDENQLPATEINRKISPTPYILIHGNNDDIVLPYHAEELYKSAKGPKELIWIEGGDHLGDSKNPYRQEALDKMIDTLNKYVLDKNWMSRIGTLLRLKYRQLKLRKIHKQK
jgi:alpha-beta hydrolase superfamily lysophospholipase